MPHGAVNRLFRVSLIHGSIRVTVYSRLVCAFLRWMALVGLIISLFPEQPADEPASGSLAALLPWNIAVEHPCQFEHPNAAELSPVYGAGGGYSAGRAPLLVTWRLWNSFDMAGYDAHSYQRSVFRNLGCYSRLTGICCLAN